MTATREVIDIEALLVRAYREKAVHRFGRDGSRAFNAALALSAPLAPGATFSADAKVDTSSFAARMAAREREAFGQLMATPDALLLVHDAVLELPTYFVQLGAGVEFMVIDRPALERLGHTVGKAQNGRATVTAVRPRGGRGEGREDMVPVGEPRELRAVEPFGLLMVQAREGGRLPVADLTVVGRRPIYEGEHRRVVGHVLTYETHPSIVVRDRADYAVWHAALRSLAESLAGLQGYVVTGPAAPAAPWEAPSRVLPSEINPPRDLYLVEGGREHPAGRPRPPRRPAPVDVLESSCVLAEA